MGLGLNGFGKVNLTGSRSNKSLSKSVGCGRQVLSAVADKIFEPLSAVADKSRTLVGCGRQVPRNGGDRVGLAHKM